MITVGIQTAHGIAKEIINSAPKGVIYKEIKPRKHLINKIITATSAYKTYNEDNIDLIEAPIFPVLTKKPWIYTPADAHTFMAFRFFGIPTPRKIRTIFVRNLFEQQNLIGLFFKSKAGLKSLEEYPLLMTEKILQKTKVVYPGIRKIDDKLIRFNRHHINILFSSFFIRKGGIHVLEAFELLQKEFQNIKLRICSPDNFMTNNNELIRYIKGKIAKNKNITWGWVNRNVLLEQILPETDIFVCPTYKDSYGFAIQEAMAYGIPVIATDYFAIPEIVEDGKTGFLIKIKHDPFIQNLKGYIIDYIPPRFHTYMTKEVYKYLKVLISNYHLRKKMGLTALYRVHEKFSIEKRQEIIFKAYEKAYKLSKNQKLKN